MAMKMEDWKRLQHSMSLEGWIISDEKLDEIAKEYEAEGFESVSQQIVSTTQKTGRSLLEVTKEVMTDFRKRRLE